MGNDLAIAIPILSLSQIDESEAQDEQTPKLFAEDEEDDFSSKLRINKFLSRS
jgi:hypothetical protein